MQNIFLHNYFISEPIFKILAAVVKPVGLQKGDMFIFFISVSEK